MPAPQAAAHRCSTRARRCANGAAVVVNQRAWKSAVTRAARPRRAGAAAPVDLFYSTSAPDEGFIARLRELAAQARVKLHVLVTQRDGRLDAERICRTVPAWTRAGVWFCGPAGWARSLQASLKAHFGLAPESFHRELFEFR